MIHYATLCLKKTTMYMTTIRDFLFALYILFDIFNYASKLQSFIMWSYFLRHSVSKQLTSCYGLSTHTTPLTVVFLLRYE